MERVGLVNKVCNIEQDVIDEALKVAKVVAAFSQPAVGLAKQAVKAGEWHNIIPNPRGIRR